MIGTFATKNWLLDRKIGSDALILIVYCLLPIWVYQGHILNFRDNTLVEICIVMHL